MFGLALGFIAGAVWFYQSLPKWAEESRTLPQPVVIQLEKGERLVDFSKYLQSEGLIDHAPRFRYWVKFFGDYERFQAGQYRFEGAVNPRQIIETI